MASMAGGMTTRAVDESSGGDGLPVYANTVPRPSEQSVYRIDSEEEDSSLEPGLLNKQMLMTAE